MVAHREKPDVLVVGAGPSGLMTALQLRRHKIQVQVIDKHWRTGTHSYALALHPSSLDLLDDLGLLNELSPHGQRVDTVSFYQGEDLRCQISFSDLSRRFPYVLVLPQSRLESALETALGNEKTPVLWNHRLQALHETDGHAEIARLEQVASGYPIARMEWTVAGTFTAHPTFVVGADGYRSLVREKLGIKLTAEKQPNIYSVYEIETFVDPGHELRVILDENGASVMWPMSRNRCRWSFQVAHADDHEPTLERLNALMTQRAPWAPRAGGPISWSSAVMFAPRLAQRFGRGRTWLTGDAAHMAGPVGVQSMNAGLLEATDLAERLARILDGKAKNELLEDYSDMNQHRWDALLNPGDGLVATAEADPWVKEHGIGILSCMPATGSDLQRLLRQVGLEFNPGPA
ncbi:MAG: FAD-dependent monooxygenase [Acidobacteria bacterium]|nr:FAD-dependent monooxygenase [Acidobacteriota bacterium]